MQNRLIVWLIAAVFIVYGLAFTFFPLQMAEWMTGDVPDTLPAVIDLRATYGGMSVAVGAILLMLAKRDSTLPAALSAAAWILGAMAFARTIGIFLDGGATTVIYALLVAEIIGVILVLGLRFRMKGLLGSAEQPHSADSG